LGALILRGTIPDGSGSGDGDGSGSGYGYGDGSGYGYGSGYGSGYGYGYGDGSGDGSGYGYGSGYGSGDGYGYGSGSGYGDGYGSGSGYGDGSGSKEYWLGCVEYFSEKWPETQRERLAECRDLGLPIAYWRSNAAGKACNGGSNKPVAPGTVETIPGPLQLCGSGALHATYIPTKWKGDRWWIVAMHGEVIGDDDKIGSLKREIIGEAI
jgi:hypothetical protein